MNCQKAVLLFLRLPFSLICITIALEVTSSFVTFEEAFVSSRPIGSACRFSLHIKLNIRHIGKSFS